LFTDPAGSFDTPTPPLVMETRDGGLTWSPGQLVCLPAGACLRWGAATGVISGMGSPAPQSVYTSIDNGGTWIDPGQTVELRAAAPNQLAAFSETSAALLSGASEYPLRVTQDGGITWQPMDLPPLPGSQAGGFGYPGLQILPDGVSLALNADSTGWSGCLPTPRTGALSQSLPTSAAASRRRTAGISQKMNSCRACAQHWPRRELIYLFDPGWLPSKKGSRCASKIIPPRNRWQIFDFGITEGELVIWWPSG
jgi:hypothetical protein